MAAAIAHHKAGRLDHAETGLARLLAARPDFLAALNLRAIIALQRGHTEQAVEQFARLAERQPDALGPALNLGAALRTAGRPDAAAAAYRRALARHPRTAALHAGLGACLREQGALDAAETSLREAVRLDPRNAETRYQLGLVLASSGRQAEARTSLRRALRLQPDHAEARAVLGGRHGADAAESAVASAKSRPHGRPGPARAPSGQSEEDQSGAGLGNALVQQGRLEEAVAAYRESLARTPGSAQVENNLGSALVELDRVSEACECFRRAIQLNPGFELARNNLGKAEANLGDFAAAAHAFERTLERHPGSVEAWCNLAAVRERASDLDGARAAAVEALARDSGNLLARLVQARCDRRDGAMTTALKRLREIDLTAASRRDRAFVARETGMVQDRLGDSAAAFAAFTQANRLSAEEARGRRIDRDSYARELAVLRRRFTADWLAGWTEDAPATAPAPVFLVGFPRSGTTLLGRLLDAHPDVRVLEERATFAAVLERLNTHPLGYPDCLATLQPAEIVELRRLYHAAAAAYLPDLKSDQLLVDKMPFNLVEAGLIRRLFPTARFLLTLRHPADACLSSFMQDFRPNRAMINFDSLAGTVGVYDQVMGLWRHFENVLSPDVHRVRYEDVVADVEAEARRLFDFLDLPWHAGVLDPAARVRASAEVRAPSYHQVAEPIYTRAVARWRRYEQHFAGLLPTLAPYVAAFGYDDEQG